MARGHSQGSVYAGTSQDASNGGGKDIDTDSESSHAKSLGSSADEAEEISMDRLKLSEDEPPRTGSDGYDGAKS